MIKKILLILYLCTILIAQNCYDVLRPFWGFNSTQITSSSLGSATVASGYLTSGLSSNPANYAFNKFSFMQLNYSNNEFVSTSSSITNSGINGFDIVLPISVYRGSFALSIGKHEQINYLAASNSALFKFSEEGGLSSYHIGGAVEFSRNVFIGADIKFLYGQDKMIEFSEDSTFLFKPKYDGTEITFGILHKYSRILQYGVSIDLPTSLNVKDKFILFPRTQIFLINKNVLKYLLEIDFFFSNEYQRKQRQYDLLKITIKKFKNYSFILRTCDDEGDKHTIKIEKDLCLNKIS